MTERWDVYRPLHGLDGLTFYPPGLRYRFTRGYHLVACSAGSSYGLTFYPPGYAIASPGAIISSPAPQAHLRVDVLTPGLRYRFTRGYHLVACSAGSSYWLTF